MSIWAKGSFSGNYVPHGNPASADCVIGHTFGARTDGGIGLVNKALAEFINDHYAGLPAMVHPDIAPALSTSPACIFDGERSDVKGGGIGSWGELEQACDFMKRENLRVAILVAQAFHIARVDRQAKRLAMETVVPEGLPRLFDHESSQPWTRDALLWTAREGLGAFVLHRRGQL